GVRPHAHPPGAVGVLHDPVHRLHEVAGVGRARVEVAFEVAHDRRGNDRHLAEVDVAAAAVDRDDVALFDDDTAGCGHAPALGVDVELLGAAHARLAHAARD